jgi:hypothetical protein
MLYDTYPVSIFAFRLISPHRCIQPRTLPCTSITITIIIIINLRYYVIVTQAVDSNHAVHVHGAVIPIPSSANDPVNQCCRSKLLYVCLICSNKETKKTL